MRVQRPRPVGRPPANARRRGVQVDRQHQVGQVIFGSSVAWPQLIGVTIIPVPPACCLKACSAPKWTFQAASMP